MKFNINDKVRIKLTPHGLELLQAKYIGVAKDEQRARINEAYYKDITRKDANGWTTWQMWEVMSEFGEHMYNGCKLPFETTIEL